MITNHHRTIVHMDLDSFFVSVSRLMNPKLIGIPVLVGGSSDRGVVAACSYEARVFGIHSAMPMKTARRLCPEATVIRGDYDEYSKRSDEVTQIIREDAPVYERSSIDEFYLDITGLDRFFGCYKWATELREKIKKQTGLPISFGMSQNKTVSKIATDEAKPDNQLKIDFGTEKNFLAPLSVKKIPMIGEKTYHLLRNMGIEIVETLQQMPAELMQNVLGDNGISIWKKANGIDNTPVEPYSEQKSLSQEETFDQDTIDVTRLKNILIAMTEKLCFRLRSDNRLTSCITVKIRYSNFDTHTMQCRIPYTSCDHTLIARVKELFGKLYSRRLLIRLVGVKFSHLVGGGHQVNLFEDSVEVLNLYYAMDKLRLVYGEEAVQRAVSLQHSLRGFNPFNGINSSPAAMERDDEDNAVVPIPSVKSMNTLINLKSDPMKNQAQSGAQVRVLEYLLVISPPSYLKNEVMEIKNLFAEKYGHVQAKKSKPHITLVNFLLDDLEEESLLSKIETVARFHEPFDVMLKNFHHFKTHTIYIGVENPLPVVNLVRSLRAQVNLPPSRSFFSLKPHLTITKGLTEEKFHAAMGAFEKAAYESSFIAESIVLMKHEGWFTKYEVVREFELGK